MLRALPTRHRTAVLPGRALVRTSYRRYATAPVTPSTASTSTTSTTSASTVAPVTKKKTKNLFRRFLFYSALATGTFYVSSVFVAFQNERYYDFLSESVPLGQAALEYAEANKWDALTLKDVADAAVDAAKKVQELVQGAADKAKSSAAGGEGNAVIEQAKASAQEAVQRVREAASGLKTSVEKSDSGSLVGAAKHQAEQFTGEVADLVAKAEAALSGKQLPSTVEATTTPEQPAGAPPDTFPEATTAEAVSADAPPSYNTPLPIGFEPPPGYERPKPKKAAAATASKSAKTEEAAAPEPLPLIAPSVSELAASEPVIQQLASTIDQLASYLNANPSAATNAKEVLDIAKGDLTALSSRIDKVREEERTQLESKLDEQTREYTVKLLELEMEAQDKLDLQEEDFRKFFEAERAKLVQAYREKLENELQTQTELINERLKEEVIAQGIELQRRWIREVKVQVEQERGGRLAKLDELATSLKRLERVALDHSSYLDENLRVHALWAAFRALTSVVDAPVRKPFREELRVLRHVAAAREDEVVATALDTLEVTAVPDVGVEPLADLASWFTSSVAPRVASVALVPEQNAGLVSHLASHVFSKLQFRREGLVEGDDVLSVLARAEHHLGEKDLDSAARELNQLRGTAKELLADWLAAARRRLEVQQALEVVQAQATLASLLVVS